jgi:hypothetical protein
LENRACHRQQLSIRRLLKLQDIQISDFFLLFLILLKFFLKITKHRKIYVLKKEKMKAIFIFKDPFEA